MRISYSALLLIGVTLFCESRDDVVVPSSAYIVDTIQVVIFGQEGAQVITVSDVARPSLAGVPQTLNDLIFEFLVYLDAQKFKILSDEDAVDRYLAIVQKENNMTLDQLKAVFLSSGYTYQEGREQFRILKTVNEMLDFKIRSHVIIPKKQVEAYDEQHPQIQEAEYYVQRGFVPYTAETKKERMRLLHQENSTKDDAIIWDDPFWIVQSEIADEKSFILSMKVGEISEPVDLKNGFEVYKLLDKHEEHRVALEQRYHEIVDILRRPLFNDLMEKYKKDLFESAAILWL